MNKNKREFKGNSLIKFTDTYVVVDIETTGLDFSCDIIELGAIKVQNGSIVDTFNSLVRPDPYDTLINGKWETHYVDQFISDLTGITDDMLKDAPQLDAVLPVFSNFLGDHIVVGHNIASFDTNFLYDAYFKILKCPFSNDYIDTLRLSRWLLPTLGHHRLPDIADHFNIPHPLMHRTLDDCKITKACYDYLSSEALLQYGSFDNFYAYVKNKLSKAAYALKAKDIETSNVEFDTSNPIYGSVCVFTGTLEKMSRRQAMQVVKDLGGENGDTVTKKTNFLILGNNDFCKAIKDGKSNKHKKAEKLISEGQDLSIISENVFYSMANID